MRYRGLLQELRQEVAAKPDLEKRAKRVHHELDTIALGRWALWMHLCSRENDVLAGRRGNAFRRCCLDLFWYTTVVDLLLWWSSSLHWNR